MQKTPDETKKGLSAHVELHECLVCPYRSKKEWNGLCIESLLEDALALIQQLESDKQQLEGMLAHMNQLRDAAAGRALKMEERVHQLEAERDAAITFLPRRCHLCKHVGNKMGDAPCPSFCEYITFEECPNWQWRGVQKEETT